MTNFPSRSHHAGSASLSRLDPAYSMPAETLGEFRYGNQWGSAVKNTSAANPGC
ncbi:hypothetical protein RMSM_04874 [Rhodopirellula maiorica SM1]|uniref:Uncharacterized protein n=1 Tax=Rhodopirellula maiorica SM1 TaxID=1265738 RepID=M5RFD4_9BACT|nr:hypothetical protein RMSM_04874 [Rhodopirellula maiorica SM1]